MVRVIEANPRPGYRLWLRFTDSAEGGIDLDPDVHYARVTGKAVPGTDVA